MNNAGFELELTDWNPFNGETTLTSDAFAENNALANSTVRLGIDQGLREWLEQPTPSKYGQ